MADPGTGRDLLARLLKRLIVSIVLGLALLYVGDYAVIRYRVAANKNPYGTVTVQPYYAVPRKDHKTEFLFDDPQDQTCIHSIFPHFGDSPCWYLNRNKQKRIDM
jgi:hypothetical protein